MSFCGLSATLKSPALGFRSLSDPAVRLFSQLDQVMNFFKPIPTSSTLFATCGAMLLLVGAATAPAQAAGYTKVNSGSLGSHTYEVWKKDTGTLTWTDAKNYAASMLGGALVSINTQAENDYVATLIQNASLYTAATSPPDYVGPYIGLQRLGSSGPTVGWQWLDGTPLTSSDPLWSNWNSMASQPDGMNGDNAALYYNGNNGSSMPLVGQPGFPTVWGDVYDGVMITTGPGSPGPNLYLANSFVIEKVPGPLPVLGALAAFRVSRRLRRRSSVAVRSI